MKKRIPVMIMAYSRTLELELLLQSVLSQRNLQLNKYDFYLALDHHSDQTRSAIIALSKKYLPNITILNSESNLGIFKNFHRAEVLLFETKKHPFSLFLEDDLILSPHYFDLIDEFIDYMKRNPHVGMMSGRGNAIYPSKAEQENNKSSLVVCDEHNWGFVLGRNAWIARRLLLKEYEELMLSIPYRTRNKEPYKSKIRQIQKQLGFNPEVVETSQDSMKNAALRRAGFCRLSSFTVNAQYIGVDGEHSNIEKFRKKGHLHQVVFRATEVSRFN